MSQSSGAISWGCVGLLVAWTGCSTIGPGSGDDETTADAGSSDLDATAPLGPFSMPRLIEPLSAPGENDDDPTVTGDLLELYFNSSRGGNSDLYFSVRDAPEQPWGDPEPVPGMGINTGSNETAPELSTDGLTLYFSSNRSGGKGSQDIFRTTREARDAPWEQPVRVPELNSTAADYSPVEDESGLRIFFYSTRDGDQDLFTATRPTTDDTWRELRQVSELNSGDSEADPFISADGLSLYFGAGADGIRDIQVARRLARDSEFDPPAAIDELNSSANDTDPWLSPDGRYLILMSVRSGDSEIYESSR